MEADKIIAELKEMKKSGVRKAIINYGTAEITFVLKSFTEMTKFVEIMIDEKAIDCMIDADEIMKTIKFRFVEKMTGDPIEYIQSCALKLYKKHYDNVQRAVLRAFIGDVPENWAMKRIYHERGETQVGYFERLIRKMVAISGVCYNDRPFESHDASSCSKHDREIWFTNVIRGKDTSCTMSLPADSIQSIRSADEGVIFIDDNFAESAVIRRVIEETWYEDPAKIIAYMI